MKRQIFKHAKKFLPLIGILLLAYLIYSLGVEDVKNAFLSIKPIYIVIAFSLTLPRVIIRNYAWQIMQREQKIQIKFWQSLKIFLIGYFYGSFTPAYAGQLMRVPYMKEKTGQPYGKLFINVVIEIVVHTIGLWIMIIIGALLVITKNPIVLYGVAIYIAILGLILFYFTKKERGEKLFFKLIKYLIPKKLKCSFNSFVETFYTDFPSLKKLILPLIIGLSAWVLIFSQEYVFVIALGVPIPYIYFIMLFPIANAIGFIPVTFAGIGLRELSAVGLFTLLFSLTPEDQSKILVVSLMGFIVTDVFTGFIGFLLSLTETRDKSYKNFLKS